VKVTETVHEAPAARLPPQVLVSLKPVPAVIDEIVADALPVFFTVTVCGAEDDPVDTEPKASELGVAVSVAEVGVVVVADAWLEAAVPAQFTASTM
jgi:hypothetical protein